MGVREHVHGVRAHVRLCACACGAVLGRFWIVLGVPGGPQSCCGPHGARFFKNHIFLIDFGPRFDRVWSPKGCPEGGPREPKIDQNRTQNESKFKTIFKSEKVGLQEPLGAVLGRSWDILEAILGSKFALRY